MEFCFDDGGDLGYNFPATNNHSFNGNIYLSEIGGIDDDTLMTSYLEDLMDSNNPFFNRSFPSSCDCSSDLQLQGSSCLSPCLLSGQSNESETTDVSMGTSVEEYVLQEFEALMAQLSDKVRIGFRDTFYRLAEDSRSSPLDPNQSVSTERSGVKETSAIDSAVAGLMYNRMETNMRDFPVVKQELEQETRPVDYTSDSLEQCCYFSTTTTMHMKSD